MADLIDRKELLAKYDYYHEGEPGKARKLIEAAPSVDAVEVVRCKDCAKDGLPSCPIFVLEHQYLSSITHDPDFFCGYGERKD